MKFYSTKSKLLIICTLVLFVSFYSCMVTGIKGNGIVKTETRNVSDFNSIKISTGLDLHITQTDAEKVEVIADENLHEFIKVEKEGNTLNIYLDKNVRRAEKLQINVSLKNIENLHASAGADVVTENTLKLNVLKLEFNSGADGKLKIDAKEIICETSSGANISLSGSVQTISAESGSGSDINAYSLQSDTCVAIATSGSNIEVMVNKAINARASSGGSINYKGNPDRRIVDKSSGGDVNQN